MFLSRLVIKNYRSIKYVDIPFSKGKNVIVGRNNAGKSNIIKALNLILGEGSPTYHKNQNISETDFFGEKKIDESGKETFEYSDEIFIFCELNKGEDEELDYDEINKCQGYYKLLTRKASWQESVDQDEEKRISNFDFSEDGLDDSIAEIFKSNLDDFDFDKRTQTRWIDSKIENQRKFKDEFLNKNVFAFAFFAKVNEDRTIKKEIRFLYKENKTKDWLLGFTAPIRNEFLQSAIIPSFRDPNSQLRLNQWSWYGKLMLHLTCNHGKEKELADAFTGVKIIADKIFENAKGEIQGKSLSYAFPEAEICFQFNNDIKTDIYKNCSIYVNDGIKSELSDKGSGIQSAVIIGLFSYYTREINVRSSALLCIEEPELYLHPHARRVISDNLDKFLDGNKNQVILTTHSSEFIRTIDEGMNIILVKKRGGETTASTIPIKKNKSLLLDNNHNEIFFSDRVIICENLEHYILKWVAKEKFQKSIDTQNISIITGGGKDSIIDFTKLLERIGINAYVFADFDFFLRDESVKAIEYGKSRKSIENLTKAFFKKNYIFGSEGEEKFKEIQSLRQKLRVDKEELFYKAKNVSSFENVEEIKSVLSELKVHGICILDGEIEDLSRDKAYLNAKNKLNYNKIFDISKRINNGEKISDIFETDDIEKFLKFVFES